MMRRGFAQFVWLAAAVLAIGLLLGACGATPKPAAPSAAPPSSQPTTLPTEQPAPSPTVELPVPSPKPSAASGMALFAANCASCHGAAGDGSGLAGAANFTDVQFVAGKSPAQFYMAIRDGVAGTAMPAWGSELSDAQIWDVLYYERSLATSPERVYQGEELFVTNCVPCHGEAGDGSALSGAANFTDQAFMTRATSQRFQESIANGLAGTAMPAWGDTLSQDQIRALVDYVWTFAYEYDLAVPESSPTAAASASAAATESAVSPTPATTATEPAVSPTPAATATPALPAEPDPAVGQALWQQKPCLGCHGANAEGDVGPRLAGTPLTFDEVLFRVRTGKAPMPAFDEQQISDLELEHIYAWFQSLAPPTATPQPTSASKPLPPSGHLMAFWEHVNRVKVHSDYAKDASPDIGSLHGRVTQARDEANGALVEADLAIADIPDPAVRATIGQVKGFMTQLLQHIEAALATQDLNAAHAEAAGMVEISRLDAWPLASLAVKQAGFTGAVRVRVRDQSGNPISGALVTALTAPSPSAGITGSDGRVIITDLAAVRLMQVKAYVGGLVYHEVQAQVPQGGRVDVDITLPGPATAGQAPTVANASISPASGPGNARVTFRMTGTDPQGHDNIAEDQVFALIPTVGVAYVLRSAGGDDWQTTVTLPNLASGTHTWYFFIVDHQCNTSNVIPLTYTVP
jgi:mono/diheme cytochrome c family protein